MSCDMRIVVLYVCMSWYISTNVKAAVNHADGVEDVKEYCLNEEFQATCLKSEVVVMKSAVFGRMTMGRCLQDEGEFMLKKYGNDQNYFGCSINVMSLANAKCSGKNRCKIDVFDDIDQQIQRPCLPALRNYLDASYECVTIIEPDRSCTVSVTSNFQYIATVNSSTKLSCGTRHQPWKLEATAGQQIDVSLLDFGGAVTQPEGDCLQYGYIIDKDANKNVSICGFINARNKIIYQSKGNVLSLILTNNLESTHLDKTLVGLQAVGCTDVVPPEDMWLKRRNQEAVVGCYSSRQTWHLNCVHNQWLGVIGNCTREALQVDNDEQVTGKPAVNMLVWISILIIVIGLLVCVAVITCGVICIRRYNLMLQMAKCGHSDKMTKSAGLWKQNSNHEEFHPFNNHHEI